MRNKKSKLDTLLGLSFNLLRTGRSREASDLFRQILQIDPKQPDALHYLGVYAHETGRLEEAVQLIVQSLQVFPNNAGALNSLAGVLKDQRRFPEALEFYQAAVGMSPNESYLHSNLGLIYIELKQLEAAIACFEMAIKLDSKSCPAHSNLGRAYQNLGDWNKALECYFRALSLKADEPIVLSNIGSILNEQGRYADALSYHEAALRISPNSDVAHSNLGAALQALGRVPEGIASCWRALQINPKSYNALNNLGNAYRRQGDFGQAIACLKKAVELEPANYLAYNNLGTTYSEEGLLEESLGYFRKALELEPTLMHVHRNLGATLYLAGETEESVGCLRKALELKPDCAEAFSDLLFALNHLRQDTPAALFAEHVRFGKQFEAPFVSEKRQFLNFPDPDRRLRVGFVSGDLREHPVANFIEPVFSNIDKSQFEIYCYENHPVNDAVSERLKTKVEFWANVDRMSDEELASRIREDGIDILVDLSGHTTLNRLLVFARKPAPVQVTMIGYMQTTGLSAMDYRITDESLDPTGSSEHLSTEKLIRLPAGASRFVPPENCPPVNELPALKNGYVTFASFNKTSKITPEAVECWARLLKATPGSKLLVMGGSSQAVVTGLGAHGIGPERLELLKIMPMKGYLEVHHRVDFYLDTFPYNGGTTSLIATWMGLPFVTIEGCSTISRVGACILRGVGLDELIATTSDEYVEKAVAAVQDLPRLAEWRSVLRERRMAGIGGDTTEFTKQLEGAFRGIWREWCERVLKDGEEQLVVDEPDLVGVPE